MYAEEDFLPLSGIQHFAFCKRQWALIHIEKIWSENGLTAEGRVIHDRVHDASIKESRGDEVTVRGLRIKSAALGLSGQCDAVVFSRDDKGVELFGKEKKWIVTPVEYKHGKTKTNDCDRLQVTAQAMCLEEMLCCSIRRGAVYYSETHSREWVDLTEDLRDEVVNISEEMHYLFKKGYTPKQKGSDRCFNCSLINQCLPEILKPRSSVRDYIARALYGEDEQ